MKSGLMNRVCSALLRLTGLALCLAVLAARSALVPLPPLARVTASDPDGASWRQSGEISGTVAGAHGDFSAAMARAGWVLQKTIVLGRVPQHSELMMWRKNKQQVLLMIWEKRAGLCGFSWGVET